LNEVNLDLYTTFSLIKEKIDQIYINEWLEELNKIDDICGRIKIEKAKTLKRKFDDLMSVKSRPKEKEKCPLITHSLNFVTNLTDKTFSSEEIQFLNQGLKHKVVPKKAKLEDIIVNIESSINRMQIDDNQRNEIRYECKKVLEKFNPLIPPNRHNRHDNEIIKSLRDKNVLYMKPDKGKGVVIMEKDEYDRRLMETIVDGPYQEVQDGRWKNSNPVHKMENDTRKVLFNLMKNNHMNSYTAKSLIVSNPRCPQCMVYQKSTK
jgi:hypothetical protein